MKKLCTFTLFLTVVILPAIVRVHSMNLFHFFDLFPLVSSQNRTTGMVTTGIPLALCFEGWTEQKFSHSLKNIYYLTVLYDNNGLTLSESVASDPSLLALNSIVLPMDRFEIPII